MAKWIPSPNFEPRQRQIDMIVIHYTEIGLSDALQRLCDPQVAVSSHYVITKMGELIAMVLEKDCAWHAGESIWQGLESMNHNSIGIELENSGQEVFPELQMAVLESLVKDLIVRYSIPPQRILGHADIAPWRKIDPGPLFDWPRLHALGLGLGMPIEIQRAYHLKDESSLQKTLKGIGYSIENPPVLDWLGILGLQVLHVNDTYK